MKKRTLAIIGMFLLSGALFAHHSWGGIYDLQKQVLLRGRVVKMTYRNPHSTLTIETRHSGTWEGEWTSWDVGGFDQSRRFSGDSGESLPHSGLEGGGHLLGSAASCRRLALDKYGRMAWPSSD